jgi:hypothetical protein
METGTRNIMIASAVGLLFGIALGVGVSSAAKKSKKKCGCEEDEHSELDTELKKEDDLKQPEIKKSQKVASPIQTVKENDDFPLALGSVGKRVERLQVFLMRHFGGAGAISNVYDQETHERVLKYLKRKNIDQVTYDRLQMDKMVHDQRVKTQP